MTDITEYIDVTGCRGWVLYDAECPLCVGLAARFQGLLERRGFSLAPLQSPWVREHQGLRPDAVLTEMRILTGQQKVLGGADAVVYLARTVWWAWPLVLVSRIPLMMPVLRRAYRWVARRRHCASRICGLRKGPCRA